MRWWWSFILLVAALACFLAGQEAQGSLRRLTEGSASSRLWDKEGLRAVVAQLAQSARAAKLSGRLDEPKQLAVSGPPEDQAQLQQAAAQVFQDLLGALQGWSYQKDGLLVTPSYDDAVARVADATKKLSTLDVAEATRIVDLCLDAGVNFFDTADIYSDGLSETILGKAIEGRRHDVLISTKASFRLG